MFSVKCRTGYLVIHVNTTSNYPPHANNKAAQFTFNSLYIQIRLNVLSSLIWVQPVCKGYQQTTLAGRVNNFNFREDSEYVLYYIIVKGYLWHHGTKKKWNSVFDKHATQNLIGINFQNLGRCIIYNGNQILSVWKTIKLSPYVQI